MRQHLLAPTPVSGSVIHSFRDCYRISELCKLLISSLIKDADGDFDDDGGRWCHVTSSIGGQALLFHKSKGILHGTLYSDGPHLLCYFYLVKLCYIVLHCFTRNTIFGIQLYSITFTLCYIENNTLNIALHCVTLCDDTVLHCLHFVTFCYIVLHGVTLFYIVLHCFTLCYIVLHGVTLYLMFYMDTLLEHSNSAATFMPRQREFYMEFIFGRNLPRHQRENRQ